MILDRGRVLSWVALVILGVGFSVLFTLPANAQVPVLGIEKSSVPADGSSVQPGDTIAYTITYNNTGNDNATNVAVIDAVPTYTTYITGTASGTGTTITYSHDGGSTYDFSEASPVTHINWTRGTLTNGTTGQTVSFQVTVNTPLDDGTTINNQASIESDELAPADSNTVAHYVSSAPILSIDKTDDPDPVVAGQELTYTITYENTGNMIANNVVITETYNNNVAFMYATPVPDGGTNNMWTMATLPIDGSHTIEITVKVAPNLSKGTTILNVVQISSDEITTPVQATEETTANRPENPVGGRFGPANFLRILGVLLWVNTPLIATAVAATILAAIIARKLRHKRKDD
jgi:uncharacterized repeat protein (TIGR01451 family)